MEKGMIITLGIVAIVVLICIFLIVANKTKVWNIPAVTNIWEILGVGEKGSELLNPRFRIFYHGAEVAGIDHAGNMNMSGNLSQVQNSYHCLNAPTCTQWIKANSTGVFIQG